MGRGFAWGILLAALASFFSGLALVPLFDLDEGAFSAATLEMFARGDFLASLNRYAQSTPLQPRVLSQWLDFGHLQTFFRSRLAVTTARAFNTVRIDGLTAVRGMAFHFALGSFVALGEVGRAQPLFPSAR